MFSIIIPSYNHARYIGKCIDSVINQRFKKWEVIIIDNNSTDNTDEVVNQYNDARIKYFKIDNDGIIAKSRNLGIKNAQYKWIAFLDSDDMWHEKKLEMCFNMIMKNKTIDVLYHDVNISYEKKNYFKKKIYRSKILKKPVIKQLLINGNIIPFSSSVVRKNLIIKVGYTSTDPSLIAADDYILWIKIAKFSDNFYYLPHLLGTYLKHSSSISNKDMSDVTLNSVLPYIDELNNKEKNIFYSNIYYMKSKFKFLENSFKYKDLNYKNISNLNLTMKVKFLYLFFHSLLKICSRKKSN